MADTKLVDNFTNKTTGDKIEICDTEARTLAEQNASEITDLNETLMQSGDAAHNAIYRGKYLGAEVTSKQYAAISDGSFDDLYIGDYWTIGGVNWRIAGLNYYYATGSASNFNKNHVVIVPDRRLYTATMNDTNTTEGGYVGSLMYTANIEQARETIKDTFGEAHVAVHNVYLTTGTTDGRPSSAAWSDEDVLLMNEQMVYGCPIRQQMSSGGTNYSLATVEKSQLPLFRYAPQLQNIRQDYWLRDIVSASGFALVGNSGLAAANSASNSFGVRPAFCLIS